MDPIRSVSSQQTKKKRLFLKRLFQVCYMGCFLLTMHSCVLYRPYKRPYSEVPDQWRVESDESSTTANVRWWQQLQDPILDELIEEALDNNQDLFVATARIAEFRARLGIVRSELFPQVAAEALFSRQRTSQNLPGEAPTSTSSSAGALGALFPAFDFIPPLSNNYQVFLNAAYELDLFGRLQSATDAAAADLLGQVEARRTVILTVVSSVAAAYIQLRQYDRQLTVSIQTVISRKESYHLAKLRFEEGLTSELEVKQAASELDEAVLQVIQFQTLIPQQENLISILVGHPPKAIERGLAVDEWQLPPEIPIGLPADLLDQRPDLLQAEQQIVAANARIGEARALYFPDITLTGYYGYQSDELHNLFANPSRAWQWAANLLQPIFTGGRITSTVDLTKAVKREAFYTYQQTILTALREVNDALIGHQNAKRALTAQYKRVHDLQDYLHLARLQYDNGLVDYLNVLDAERKLFTAQLDLAQSQALVFLTLVNLYKALGGGWVIDAENLMNEERNVCS